MDRHHGFDYLRCFACIAVVAIHCALFESSDLALSRVINRNVVMLAVPVFLLMSLYLFNKHGYPLKQRLTRYVWLYLFWVGIYTFAFGGWASIGGAVSHGNVGGLLGYILTGGHSLFYFLVALIFLTFISYAFRELPSWVLVMALVASVVLIAALSSGGAGRPSVYLVFVPFLPLAFVGLLASRGSVGLPWIGLLAVVSLVAALVEWHYNLDASYSRTSVTGFSSVAFLLALRVRSPAPRPLVTLADCSLGVYCLHVFLIAFFQAHIGMPVRFWPIMFEYVTVFAWSVMVVLGIKRALAYKMI